MPVILFFYISVTVLIYGGIESALRESTLQSYENVKLSYHLIDDMCISYPIIVSIVCTFS